MELYEKETSCTRERDVARGLMCEGRRNFLYLLPTYMLHAYRTYICTRLAAVDGRRQEATRK